MSIFGDTILNFTFLLFRICTAFLRQERATQNLFQNCYPFINIPKRHECTHGDPECLLPACTCAVTNLDNPAQREKGLDSRLRENDISEITKFAKVLI